MIEKKDVDLRDVKLDVKLQDDQPRVEQVACDDTPPNMSDDDEAPPADQQVNEVQGGPVGEAEAEVDVEF